MILNDSVGQTKAQTGSLSFVFGGKKRFEDLGKMFFGYPRSCVGYFDTDLFFVREQETFYCQNPLSLHGLGCIENNVRKQVVQLLDVR